MSTIQQIKDAVSNLSREELTAFRNWFIEFDWQAWDKEIEEDIAAVWEEVGSRLKTFHAVTAPIAISDSSARTVGRRNQTTLAASGIRMAR